MVEICQLNGIAMLHGACVRLLHGDTVLILNINFKKPSLHRELQESQGEAKRGTDDDRPGFFMYTIMHQDPF